MARRCTLRRSGLRTTTVELVAKHGEPAAAGARGQVADPVVTVKLESQMYSELPQGGTIDMLG